MCGLYSRCGYVEPTGTPCCLASIIELGHRAKFPADVWYSCALGVIFATIVDVMHSIHGLTESLKSTWLRECIIPCFLMHGYFVRLRT